VAVSYDLDDSFQVLFCQMGPGWQIEPAIEKVFAHPSPYDTTVLKHRLEVHGLPDGLGCFDID